MKTALAILIIILAVLATGCTSQAPAAPAATPAVTTATPDLVGIWTGTNTEQQGRIFAGYLTFGTNTTHKIPLAGVVSRDGRTFTMVEDVNGYTSGEFTGSDEIQLTHIDDSQPYGAALDTLKKV